MVGMLKKAKISASRRAGDDIIQAALSWYDERSRSGRQINHEDLALTNAVKAYRQACSVEVRDGED